MPDRLALLVDLTGAQSHDGADHGVARVTQELAASLVRVPGLVRGLLLNPSLPIPGSLHPALLTSPLVTWNTASEVRRLAAGGPLAYLMPAPLELGPPSATQLPPHLVEGSFPILAVLHDLDPMRFPDRDMEGRDRALRYHARLRLYGEATRVLAVSRSTARDGVRLLGLDPDRVDVIGLGVAPWDAVAQRVATVTAGVATAGGGAVAPPRRWRIAVVGAQPPSASPAAAPNRLLLTALAARAEVHAISDSPHVAGDDDITRLPPDALERHGLIAGYDALVFGLAGHADDAAALRLARRHPGIVCLHDIRLGAGPRDHDPPGEGPALEIVRGARAVVVGSEPEARRLRLDIGPAAPPARLCVAASDPGDQADQILRLVAGASGAPAGTSP